MDIHIVRGANIRLKPQNKRQDVFEEPPCCHKLAQDSDQKGEITQVAAHKSILPNENRKKKIH